MSTEKEMSEGAVVSAEPNHAVIEVNCDREDVLLAWFGGYMPKPGMDFLLRATSVIEKDGCTSVSLVLVPAY